MYRKLSFCRELLSASWIARETSSNRTGAQLSVDLATYRQTDGRTDGRTATRLDLVGDVQQRTEAQNSTIMSVRPIRDQVKRTRLHQRVTAMSTSSTSHAPPAASAAAAAAVNSCTARRTPPRGVLTAYSTINDPQQQPHDGFVALRDVTEQTFTPDAATQRVRCEITLNFRRLR